MRGLPKKKGEEMAEVEKKVAVPLPPGMSEAEFVKIFSTFTKARIAGKQRDAATRAAHKRLIAAHEAEYNKYYAEEFKKQGE